MTLLIKTSTSSITGRLYNISSITACPYIISSITARPYIFSLVHLTSINLQKKILKNTVFKSTIFFQFPFLKHVEV
jgi:hypothetical protein